MCGMEWEDVSKAEICVVWNGKMSLKQEMCGMEWEYESKAGKCAWSLAELV